MEGIFTLVANQTSLITILDVAIIIVLYRIDKRLTIIEATARGKQECQK